MMKLLAMLLIYGGLAWAQSPEHHVHDKPGEVEPFERGFPDYFYQKKPTKEVKGLQKYDLGKDGSPPGPTNFDVSPVHDNPVFGFLFFDRLEERFEDRYDKLLWDVTGTYGPKKNQVFIESEGTYNTDKGADANSRNEILYGHLVDSFWFGQVGYRRDFVPKKDDREFLVVSAQGMTPFQFEIDAAAYLADGGQVSGIFEAEYTFLLSQRTMLIPRFETEISSEKVKEYNIGAGIGGYELGFRLAHQIVREFAPYVGVSWEKKLFETADLLEDAGEDTSEGLFLVGVRMVL